MHFINFADNNIRFPLLQIHVNIFRRVSSWKISISPAPFYSKGFSRSKSVNTHKTMGKEMQTIPEILQSPSDLSSGLIASNRGEMREGIERLDEV